MTSDGATLPNTAAAGSSRGDQSFHYAPLRLRLGEASIGFTSGVTAGGITALAVGGWLGWLIGVVGAVVTVWATHRGFRLSLRATHEGLEVTNYWREYRFPWSDVEKVGLGLETMGIMPRAAAAFGLRDGRTIKAQATPERVKQQEIYFAALRRLAPDHIEYFIEFLPPRSEGPEPRQ